MLVQLPAIDAVAVAVHASVPWPPSAATVAHALARPSVWLAFLATLVVLASIRAALVLLRPPVNKAPVSLLVGTSTSEKPSAPSIAISSTTTPSSAAVPTAASAASAIPPAEAPRPTTSWLWGLVRWEALPALPVARGRGWAQAVGMQQAQGILATQQQQQRFQQQQQHPQQQRGRRGPAFEHPLPALYEAGPPVSMAKMIMSRHTFRRPTSRPPPARSANTVQYQRRSPSMV
ncbi:hypothetical protein HYPSUDRAFT_66817 [Hypholoma sublateritium FD-334 SS-4]|uniref:Uncharacterized protein n=1 Tax=Hypholoma sublateritium (strain FD-334 SS-4) TaxID=945553 RepID=A0A0D2NVJ5_HYPSF|nr:hypothetical protein HYPSUDRAFT_66817 [Hypholoma sublateritium FD-334 SS-4]